MKLFVLLAIFIALAKGQEEATQARIKEIISRLPKFPKSSNNSRVVGGESTIPHVRKYQVALALEIWNEWYFCSGTLISTKFVLTAAHCVIETSRAEVILGAYNLYIDEPCQVIQSVSSDRFRVHEEFDMDTAANDVATIALLNPAELNEFIQPVQLPSFAEEGKSFALKKATIVGWGKISDDNNALAPTLQEADATILWNFVCSVAYKVVKYPIPVLKSNICTSGAGGTNACNGDSGGPLLIGNKQVGIVSWGYYSCEAGFPSVFTRITSHLLWIQANSDVVIASK